MKTLKEYKQKIPTITVSSNEDYTIRKIICENNEIFYFIMIKCSSNKKKIRFKTLLRALYVKKKKEEENFRYSCLQTMMNAFKEDN